MAAGRIYLWYYARPYAGITRIRCMEDGPFLPVSSNGYNLSLFFSAAAAAQGTPLSMGAKVSG